MLPMHFVPTGDDVIHVIGPEENFRLVLITPQGPGIFEWPVFTNLPAFIVNDAVHVCKELKKVAARIFHVPEHVPADGVTSGAGQMNVIMGAFIDGRRAANRIDIIMFHRVMI